MYSKYIDAEIEEIQNLFLKKMKESLFYKVKSDG